MATDATTPDRPSTAVFRALIGAAALAVVAATVAAVRHGQDRLRPAPPAGPDDPDAPARVLTAHELREIESIRPVRPKGMSVIVDMSPPRP